MREITAQELSRILEVNNSAFLCGNGFSMNFDSSFSTVYDRIDLSFSELIHRGQYTIMANDKFKEKCLTNYSNVKEYLRSLPKKKIE